MDPKFAKLVDSLAPKLKELLAMKPVRYRAIPMTLPMKGVYLLSKGNKHLYVGRSNAIRKRFHRLSLVAGRDSEPWRSRALFFQPPCI